MPSSHLPRILITGGSGQVGHCLKAQLEGCAELSVPDSSALNIADRHSVRQAVETFRPDYIINAAAYTAVDKAENDAERAFAVNRDGARHLAEAAEAAGAAMLHISTDYVFDGAGGAPYDEAAPTAPQNIYGASKLAGEQAVLAACRRAVVMRTSWVFGAHGQNFVKTMLRLGRERDSLGIVADQYGAPTAAADIAAALITIVRRHTPEQLAERAGIYHYCGSPYASWFEFAETIFAEAAAQGVLAKIPAVKPIATADYPTPAKRPADSRLDCGKIRVVFGIGPCDWHSALSDLRPYL
ncbi:dTDP-4-dehydrorhamnose reductase [Neisseria elongata]|uniref:dTDP-4-dehydrorhamnose reductase n=1 Tax=Neisseria elongata TaxID=495 RepID=UPI000D321DC4|nr:dTDP-4-dehydrorhamnose reductase [Neisseria elongata]